MLAKKAGIEYDDFLKIKKAVYVLSYHQEKVCRKEGGRREGGREGGNKLVAYHCVCPLIYHVCFFRFL